jgi:hypothetical protein
MFHYEPDALKLNWTFATFRPRYATLAVRCNLRFNDLAPNCTNTVKQSTLHPGGFSGGIVHSSQ